MADQQPPTAPRTTPAPPPPDLERLTDAVDGMGVAFSGLTVTVLDRVELGDQCVTRCLVSGTHTGTWRSIAPTGKSIAIEIVDIVHRVDGAVVERWDMADESGLLAQLLGPG